MPDLKENAMRMCASGRCSGAAALEVKAGYASTKTLNVGLELKEVSEDGAFSGYGSVFDHLDTYADRVSKGAFKSSLAAHKQRGTMPKLLWQHDQKQPIGIYTAMREDDRGLWLEGQLALKTRQGAEAYELLKMGALSGLSIGFATVRSERDEKTGIRTLKEVELWEVSVVTFPACDPAGIHAVKAADRIKSIRDFEGFLRDEGGFSHAQARAIASGGFKAAPDPRDEEGSLSDLVASLRRASQALST